MTPQPIFKPISDRLNFLFPPNSFVYINLSNSSNGRLPSQRRFALCEQIEQRGMSLAFPPDLDNDTLDLSQTDEAYWTYHFPGLQHLHRRKQGILVGQLLRGVDLKMAGHLILRKLNIDVRHDHYLLYFGRHETWCCSHPELQTEVNMTNLMIHVSHTGIGPWIESAFYQVNPKYASAPPPAFSKRSRNRGLLSMLQDQFSSMLRDEPDPIDWDQRALMEDEDVLNTLQALQRTETEKGFFKIIRGLVQEIYAEMPEVAMNMAPGLAEVMEESERRPFRLCLNPFTNSLEFPEIDKIVKLKPLDFALYRLFYNHPSGFRLSDRQQYLDEMRGIYRNVTGHETHKINQVLEPMFVLSMDNGSINQSISRIKARFRSQMSAWNYQPYIITGERNQPYRIACNRNFMLLGA